MTDLEAILERAQAAFDAGNPLVARGYWRRASRIAPERLDIWQSLCQVTEAPGERLRCLENIVQLDPSDRDAQDDENPCLPLHVSAPHPAVPRRVPCQSRTLSASFRPAQKAIR